MINRAWGHKCPSPIEPASFLWLNKLKQATKNKLNQEWLARYNRPKPIVASATKRGNNARGSSPLHGSHKRQNDNTDAANSSQKRQRILSEQNTASSNSHKTGKTRSQLPAFSENVINAGQIAPRRPLRCPTLPTGMGAHSPWPAPYRAGTATIGSLWITQVTSQKRLCST